MNLHHVNVTVDTLVASGAKAAERRMVTVRGCDDVNECNATDSGLPVPCVHDPHATCVNVPGAYYCRCVHLGYHWNSTSLSCEDTDECARLRSVSQHGVREPSWLVSLPLCAVQQASRHRALRKCRRMRIAGEPVRAGCAHDVLRHRDGRLRVRREPRLAGDSRLCHGVERIAEVSRAGGSAFHRHRQVQPGAPRVAIPLRSVRVLREPAGLLQLPVHQRRLRKRRPGPASTA